MDDLIVKFCEDRRSWLVVIAGTLALGLVLVLPEVDDYGAVCAEQSDLAEKLTAAHESAQQLPGFETRRAEQMELISERLGKTLTADNEPEFRNNLVMMVREAGCQLRRLNVGNAVARPWGEGDDPLERTYDNKLRATSFQLERRQVSLALVGPTANVRRLIERMEEQDTQVHVQSLDLKPEGGDGRRAELTMELWYFTLARPTI